MSNSTHSVEFCNSLKPGYGIYFVSMFFTEQVHIGGFTTRHEDFAVAKDFDEATSLIIDHYSKIGIGIKKTTSKLALEQDISRYAFADRFPGFAEGCNHLDFQPSKYQKADAEELIGRIFTLTERTSVDNTAVVSTANDISDIWGSLGYWSGADRKLQAGALMALWEISEGMLQKSIAAETLRGTCCILNQSLRYVVNFAP